MKKRWREHFLDVKTGEGENKHFLVFPSQQPTSNEEFSLCFGLHTTTAS